MLLDIYSVFDTKVSAYTLPIFRRSKGEAIRDFADMVNDGKSSFSRHPQDFCLFKIGTFDDSTGKVEHIVPEALGLAIEFLVQESK